MGLQEQPLDGEEYNDKVRFLRTETTQTGAAPVKKPALAPAMEISKEAMSGDGTIANVGIKVNGKFKSPVNNQMFDTKEALDLHLKYLYNPANCNPNIEELRQYLSKLCGSVRNSGLDRRLMACY